jgi:hypothetical protein
MYNPRPVGDVNKVRAKQVFESQHGPLHALLTLELVARAWTRGPLRVSMMGLNSKKYDNMTCVLTPEELKTATGTGILDKLMLKGASTHPMYWIRRIVAGMQSDGVLGSPAPDVTIGTRMCVCVRVCTCVCVSYISLLPNACTPGFGLNTGGYVKVDGNYVPAWPVTTPCAYKPCMQPGNIWNNDEDEHAVAMEVDEEPEGNGNGDEGEAGSDGADYEGDDDRSTDDDDVGDLHSTGDDEEGHDIADRSNRHSQPGCSDRDGDPKPPYPVSHKKLNVARTTPETRRNTSWLRASEDGAVVSYHQAGGMGPPFSLTNVYASARLADKYIVKSWTRSNVLRYHMYMTSCRSCPDMNKGAKRFMDVAAAAVSRNDGDDEVKVVDWPHLQKGILDWIPELEEVYTWEHPFHTNPFLGRCELGAQVGLNVDSNQDDIDVIEDLLSIAKENRYRAYPLEEELTLIRMVATALEGAAMAAVDMAQITQGTHNQDDIVQACHELPILLPVLRAWAKTFTNGRFVETNRHMFCPNTGLSQGRPIMPPGAVLPYLEKVLRGVLGASNIAKMDAVLSKHLGDAYIRNRNEFDRHLKGPKQQHNLLHAGPVLSIDKRARDAPKDTRYCPHCLKAFCAAERNNKKLADQVRYHPCTVDNGNNGKKIPSAVDTLTKKYLLPYDDKRVKEAMKERSKRRTDIQDELVQNSINGDCRRMLVPAMAGQGKSTAIDDLVKLLIFLEGYNAVLHINMTHAGKQQCVVGVTAHKLFKWNYKTFALHDLIYHSYDKPGELLDAVTAHINDHFKDFEDRRPFLACKYIIYGECFQPTSYMYRWMECFFRVITGNKLTWAGRQLISEGDATQNDHFFEKHDATYITSKRGVAEPGQFLFQDPLFHLSGFEVFDFGPTENNQRFGDDPILLKMVVDIQAGNSQRWNHHATQLREHFGHDVDNFYKMEHRLMVVGAHLMSRCNHDAKMLEDWYLRPTLATFDNDAIYLEDARLQKVFREAVDDLLVRGFLASGKAPDLADMNNLYCSHIGTMHAQKAALSVLTVLRYRLRGTDATLLVTNVPRVTYRHRTTTSPPLDEKNDRENRIWFLRGEADYMQRHKKTMDRETAHAAPDIYKGMQVLLTTALPDLSLYLWQRLTVEDYDKTADELIVTVHHGPNLADQKGRRIARVKIDEWYYPNGGMNMWTTIEGFPVVPAMFYTAKATTGLTLPGWVLCCNVFEMKEGDGYLMITRGTRGSKVWFVNDECDSVEEWNSWFKVHSAAVAFYDKLKAMRKASEDSLKMTLRRMPLNTFYIDSTGHVVEAEKPKPRHVKNFVGF